MVEVIEEVTVDEVVQTIKEELDAFVPLEELSLLDGRTIILPKIAWKKEKVIFQKVGELFQSIEEVEGVNFDSINPKQIVKIVTAMLSTAPDIITHLVSVITDLSEEEVEEQLDSVGITRLLVPFFSGRIQEIMEVIGESLT